MRDQIKNIDARIQFFTEAAANANAQIDTLRTLRLTMYRPSNLLPLVLMDETEKQKILGMPLGDDPCEYCGTLHVRISKKSICTDCGHIQTAKRK